jgi:glycosyltransferase involved in cell wall biosynthesis
MRILRIIASLDPAQGGPVEGLKQSAALMAEAGHETEVATLDDPNAPFLEHLAFPAHALGPARRFSLAPRLANWVAMNGRHFHAAVIHGLWNPASSAGWQGLQRAGVPYVVFTHGMLDPWFREAYPVKHWVKQAAWLAAQGWVLRDAQAVLFTSGEEKRRAAGAFFGPGYRASLVAYGAAEPPERPHEQRCAFIAAVPALGARPYLLFLGRIHEKKGCDLLVEAFAKVAADAPDLDLVIAGPDQVGLSAALTTLAAERGIAQRIHWPGLLEGDAKWGALRGAAALVMPSHQENFGIAVAEALACGVPVLISDKVNTWREIETDGASLVAPDTLAGTSDLLTRFVGLSPDQHAAMGANARACYRARFGLPKAAEDLTRILSSIARRTSP